jgi:hypothetical protein
VGVFYSAKRTGKYERLRIRPTSLVLMAAAGVVVQLVGPLAILFGEAFPCWLGLLMLVMIIPLAGGAVSARLLVFYFLSKYAQAMRMASKQEAELLLGSESVERDRAKQQPQPTHRGVVAVTRSLLGFACHRSTDAAALSSADRAGLLTGLKFFASSRGHVAIVAMFTTPYLILVFCLFASDPAYLNCGGCTQTDVKVESVLIALAGLAVAFGFFMGTITRKFPDQFGMATESRWIVLCGLLAFVAYVADVLDDQVNSPFDWMYVIAFAFWVLLACSTLVQVAIAKRDAAEQLRGRRGSRVQTTVVSQSQNIYSSLDELLSNPAMTDAFLAYLEREFAVESMLFVQDTTRWRASYFDLGQASRVARARRIVAAYISSTALYQINISSEQRDQILDAVRRDDVDRNVFDATLDEMRRLLSHGPLPRFLQSDECRESRGGSGGAPVPTDM